MKVTALRKILPQWEKPYDDDDFEFKFKQLPGPQLATLSKYVTVLPSGQVWYGDDSLTYCLQWGLLDWKNFRDGDDNEIAFSMQNIELLPPALCGIMADTIVKNSLLTDEDKKKS